MASRIWLVAVVVAGSLAVAVGARADESAVLKKQAQILRQLTEGTGVPPEAIVPPEMPVTPGPSCTLGERLYDMQKNGTITQDQYDTILARAAAMPQENVQVMKGVFDQGHGAKLLPLLSTPVPTDPDPSETAPGKGEIAPDSAPRKAPAADTSKKAPPAKAARPAPAPVSRR